MRLILLFSLIFYANAKFHWYSSLHKPWCYVKECCNEKWITRDYDSKSVTVCSQRNVIFAIKDSVISVASCFKFKVVQCVSFCE